MSLYSVAQKMYRRARDLPTIGSICTAVKPFFKEAFLRKAHLAVELEENKKRFSEEITWCRERLEFVRLELFEQMRSGGFQVNNNIAAQAEVLNREKYDQAVQAGSFRLNIGCGHKPEPEYLNVDRRSLPGVDIVAEADCLPFESGSVREIYAAHLLEHFTQPRLVKVVSYWHDVLTPEGYLRLVVPDAEAMFAAYMRGEMSFQNLREVTFGAQDYDDDFHYTMFTPGSLERLLKQSGFISVTALAVNRVNGKCREMEFSAVKNAYTGIVSKR